MKVVILAGGRGSRLGALSDDCPKPMLRVGGEPLLLHIMRRYAHHGHREFLIALGYRGEVIREYFTRPGLVPDDWQLGLRDTGLETNTGGRVGRLRAELGETFMLTWGDGLADVDLTALLAFHRRHGRLATVTAVRPPPRFGRLQLEGERVVSFEEKPRDSEPWINGAFFVLEPAVLERIADDNTAWEAEPMRSLARDGELMAYRHHGFWQCMDTPAEHALLERLWQTGQAPWSCP